MQEPSWSSSHSHGTVSCSGAAVLDGRKHHLPPAAIFLPLETGRLTAAMLQLTLIGLLATSSVLSQPHFSGGYNGYPRFHDEERPLEQPNVNVYKIYAPRLFYMPGYKTSMNNGKEENFFNRNKQMIPASENILDGMLRAEMFPDSLFDDEPNSPLQYDNDFEPAPSNIVSRKLPMYAPISQQHSMREFEPSMHLDNFYPAVGNNVNEGTIDGLQMIPDYYDLHGEHSDHHDMFHNLNAGPMNDDYSDFSAVQFIDPIFLKDIPRPAPIEAPMGTKFSPNNAGPLTSFFKKFVADTSRNSDKLGAHVLTTLSFGTPEIISLDLTSSEYSPFSGPNVAQESPEDAVAAIIAQEMAAAAGAAIASVDAADDESATDDEEVEETLDEIERNFIKTILPDNSSVTTEVDANGEETTTNTNTDSSPDFPTRVEESSEIPLEEVQVNIVKTILPDDSYLVSEAGGEDERIQDEVITMIQNTDTRADNDSKDSVSLSRHLETPKE